MLNDAISEFISASISKWKSVSSLQITFSSKPVICQARDKVWPDMQPVWSDITFVFLKWKYMFLFRVITEEPSQHVQPIIIIIIIIIFIIIIIILWCTIIIILIIIIVFVGQRLSNVLQQSWSKPLFPFFSLLQLVMEFCGAGSITDLVKGMCYFLP